MEIASGGWEVSFDGETLEGIEAAEPALSQETVDLEDIGGTKITRVKSRSAEVALTIFGTGIANLKKILPDNWVDQGTQIEGQATGVVAKASGLGVITYGKPACGTARLTAPLVLVPCENPDEHTVTLFDGVAEMTNLSIEDGVLKLEVTVRSEATGVQLAKGAVTIPDES